MPAAIPLVVGFAASTIAVEVGLVVAGSLAATLIGAGASFLASSLLAEKPKAPDLSSFLDAAGAGRTQQVRQPIAPHSVGYGRYKTSGPIMYLHTKVDDEGRANGYFYIVHALCSTKIRSIRDVYLNDGYSTDAEFSGLVRVNKHLGEASQVADADFVAECSDYGSDRRGDGIAYIATRLKWNATAFSSGIPNIAAIIDACDEIYDPRTETTGFTNNAALCIANWLTNPYGRNLDWEKIDEEALIEAANICDERVPVVQYDVEFDADDSTDVLSYTGRSLDWGDGVRVSSDGTLPDGLLADTTYYVICVLNGQIQLAETPADAFAGNAIDLLDSGTGTHTLTYYDEARYKLNGSFTLDTENGEVLDQLRSAMAGFVFPRGGKWFIHAGAAVVPSFELTADQLTGDGLQVEPKRSMRDRVNGMRGVFVNPDANWQPDDSPVLKPTAEMLEEDAGEELYGDVRSSFITSMRQMARVMKISRLRNRQQLTAQATFNFSALKIAPLDTGTLTGTRYFTDEQFQVVNWAMDESGITLQLVEDSPDIYDWSLDDEADATPRPIAVIPTGGIAPPSPIIVDTPITETFTELVISWPEVIGTGIVGYDVESSPAGAETWSSTDQTTDLTFNVETSVATDFRVRTALASAVSEWETEYAPGPPVNPILVGTGQVNWDSVPGPFVQIFNTSSALVGTFDITDAPINVGFEDAPYKIRTVDVNGNISELADVVPV